MLTALPVARGCSSQPESTIPSRSRWLAKMPNPVLVKVGPGDATGPVPLMWREHLEYADVPIPTPRPDYPVVKSSALGDTPAN